MPTKKATRNPTLEKNNRNFFLFGAKTEKKTFYGVQSIDGSSEKSERKEEGLFINV